jgi:Calcineurin-like phosphoesterase
MVLDFLIDKIVDFAVGPRRVPVSSKQDSVLYIRYPGPATEVAVSGLPTLEEGKKRLVVVGDTHERHSALTIPPCDLFIHCGDILMVNKHYSLRASRLKLLSFRQWLQDIPATNKILIAGNHDRCFELLPRDEIDGIFEGVARYLENESYTFGKYSLYATPLSTNGKSPNRAFQSDQFYSKTMSSIPVECDILISHGPVPQLVRRVKHSIHLWGHHHKSYGAYYSKARGIPSPIPNNKGEIGGFLSVCSAIMDGKFRPSHLPVVIDLVDNPSALIAPPTSSLSPSDDALPENEIPIVSRRSRGPIIQNSIRSLFAVSVKIHPINN